MCFCNNTVLMTQAYFYETFCLVSLKYFSVIVCPLCLYKLYIFISVSLSSRTFLLFSHWLISISCDGLQGPQVAKPLVQTKTEICSPPVYAELVSMVQEAWMQVSSSQFEISWQANGNQWVVTRSDYFVYFPLFSGISDDRCENIVVICGKKSEVSTD